MRIWILCVLCLACSEAERSVEADPRDAGEHMGAPDGALDFGVDLGPDAAEPRIATIEVEFDTHVARAGRLIGWNIGRGTLYGPEDSPTHPEWRTAARVEALSGLRNVRAANGDLPYMRFSGLQIDGSLGADGYHFWQFADPERAVSAEDNMAPFEWFALMAEADAEPLVMLNFGSGTAAEAADYVAHLTGEDPEDPLVQARAHWGRAEPYPVRVFEIGNEVYGVWNTGHHARAAGYANPDGGDPDWADRPASDPADYAARALAYADAVSAVYPAAEFWVPLSQASMDAWGGLEASVPALAPILEDPRVTAVVIHQYHVDDTAHFGRVSKNDLPTIVSLSERYAPLYLELRAALAAVERAAPLEIAVTEYQVAGAFARGQFQLGDAPALGLGIADMLISYAQLDIEHACQHMALNFADGDDPGRDLLLEPWYVPYLQVDGALRARSSLEVTGLFARALLRHRAQTTVDTPDTPVGDGAAPAIHAVAFSDGEDAGTVVFLNRSPDVFRVTVHSPEFGIQGGRHYSPADPLAPGPHVSSTEGAFRAVDGEAFAVGVAPYSVTALRFIRGGVR